VSRRAPRVEACIGEVDRRDPPEQRVHDVDRGQAPGGAADEFGRLAFADHSADEPRAGVVEAVRQHAGDVRGELAADGLRRERGRQRRAGRGVATEAVQLVVDYLFAVKQRYRVQLVIAPANAASARIAEKCGFVLEGTVRGAFFNDGQNNDVLLYSLPRTDPRPWHPPDRGRAVRG
jgi:hypothetical protein